MCREGEQQWFVGSEMVQHPGEKSGLSGGGAERQGIDAGQRQKPAKPFLIGGQERDRRDGKRFRLLPASAVS
jgi:hypothetical protein